jgi:hypothetical protein
VQPAPYNSGENIMRFNLSSTMTMHRLRWAGSDDLSQLKFETFNAAGTLLQSFTPTGEAWSRKSDFLML